LTERNEAVSKQLLLDPNGKLQIPAPIASLMKLDDSGVKSADVSREYIPVRDF